jgi:hypothetical protein
MNETLTGGLSLGLPALLITLFILWRIGRLVALFATALFIVGVGYLAATGALDGVGRQVLSLIGH